MKHKRFEENILVDEAYTNYGKDDKNADVKKSQGIAKHFAETLEYEEKKKWYDQLPDEPTSQEKALTQEQIEELRKEASSALHGDTLAYETKSNRSGSSDHQWARTLLNKGAIGDRVAAATILIQDNPIYNLSALRNLVSNVKPAKKKDGITIIDALSELLISDLLIPNVKLRTFSQHPLGNVDEMSSGNKQARRNILKLWYFEDQLKELYGTYVEALNKFAHDSVDANKEKAVTSMSYLLMHHPEREKVLLTNIINKLGDPGGSVASKAVYHLCQLLYNHPNMKGVVLAEIERMLFRANISPRAQYYGVCFLNQFYLGKDDSKIAESLIRIYFSFFKASIKKGEIDSRLMSAILTGVKRAYPFADGARLADTPAHVDAIYKIVHLASMNVAIHALALLFHICEKGTEDRYYSALYKKLTDMDIFHTSHTALLFSLIYKSLKRDNNTDRVAAFVKRLLQLCICMPPEQCCGILFLISQVLKDKKDAVKLSLPKEEFKEEVKDEIPQAIKDDNTNITLDEDLDTEVNKTKVEDLRTDVEPKKEFKVDLLKGDKKDLLIDDDEETYVDLKIDEEGNIKPKRRKASAAVGGWHHARVAGTRDERVLETNIQLKKMLNSDRVITRYNPCARNPSYAGAQHSAYVELLPLSRHFHPTVRMFATKLLHDEIIHYSGDPLKDFSCIRFLDRFVFKNPKKRPDDVEVDGVKKIRGSHPKFAARKNYSAKGLKSIPVNSSSYLNEPPDRIPVDERFLYDYLQKRRDMNEAEDKDSDSDSDADSVNSDDFDKYLDTVTGSRNDEEELDFLADIETTKQMKRNKKADGGDDVDLGSDDDDDDDDEEIPGEDDASDGELDMSGDEDEPKLSADEDELLLEGSDDEMDDIIDDTETKSGKRKKGLKIKGNDDLGSLFASAEQFSTLLEETASNKRQGSSQAVSNTDNSSKKQLAWEENRDKWIKGYNRKILGNKKSGKGKHFNKKSNNKMGAKPGHKMAANQGKMAVGGKRKGGKFEAGGKKKKTK